MLNSDNSNHTMPAFRLRVKQAGLQILIQWIVLVVLLIFSHMSSGCGGPEIDASNNNSMQSSIHSIRSMLPPENKAEFDKALTDLNDMLFNRTDAVSQATISLYRPDALMRKILHGKSARDVIEMVEEHRQKLTNQGK